MSSTTFSNPDDANTIYFHALGKIQSALWAELPSEVLTAPMQRWRNIVLGLVNNKLHTAFQQMIVSKSAYTKEDIEHCVNLLGLVDIEKASNILEEHGTNFDIRQVRRQLSLETSLIAINAYSCCAEYGEVLSLSFDASVPLLPYEDGTHPLLPAVVFKERLALSRNNPDAMRIELGPCRACGSHPYWQIQSLPTPSCKHLQVRTENHCDWEDLSGKCRATYATKHAYLQIDGRAHIVYPPVCRCHFYWTSGGYISTDWKSKHGKWKMHKGISPTPTGQRIRWTPQHQACSCALGSIGCIHCTNHIWKQWWRRRRFVASKRIQKFIRMFLQRAVYVRGLTYKPNGTGYNTVRREFKLLAGQPPQLYRTVRQILLIKRYIKRFKARFMGYRGSKYVHCSITGQRVTFSPIVKKDYDITLPSGLTLPWCDRGI